MIAKKINGLDVNIFGSRDQLGKTAANDIVIRINELLKTKLEIRMIFAAAPSQNEMLEHLIKSDKVDWSRIVAFHMDEYIGLQKGASQLFSEFLKEKLFNHVPFKKVHLIDGNNSSYECLRYSKLISMKPIDIVCMGIGENGHIAFNDPPVADFNDPEIMKKVKLDYVCRQQQVHDGCFSSIDHVPEYAYTLTIPTLMKGAYLFCVVPGKSKREAVSQTLYNPEITTKWPSTVLRNHAHCKLYFDNDSFNEKTDN
ncbi:MAG: glucosamine-6-phosphate deaminase [Bacteroidales bacterium]|nr:glucosamine-6-phosphate deaminase [Bacteroidales bacterium]